MHRVVRGCRNIDSASNPRYTGARQITSKLLCNRIPAMRSGCRIRGIHVPASVTDAQPLGEASPASFAVVHRGSFEATT